MKKMLVVASAAFLLILSLSLYTAFAEDDYEPEDPVAADPQEQEVAPAPPRPLNRLQAIQDELGLTEDQIQQFQQMSFTHQREMIEFSSRMQVAQLELQNLMRQYGNDDAVLAKHAELEALITQGAEMKIRHQLERRALFTEEQWQKVSTLRRFAGSRWQRPGAGMGMMRRGGRGMRGMAPGFNRGRGYGRGLGVGPGWGAGYGRGFVDSTMPQPPQPQGF